MLASLACRTYHRMIALYPNELRRQYGEDMEFVFNELIADRGVLAATTRTTIDLIVTVPRYRLEAVMSKTHATRTLNVAIAGLLALGAFGATALGTDGLGTWIFAGMILTGLGLAIANRGRLARSIRTANPSQRSHRLRLAALNAGVFAASVVAYLIVVWDEEASTPGLLIPSLLGTVALVGAIGFLLAGLFTPRTPNPALG